MVDIELLKTEIISHLIEIKPDRIILFGSYANGNAYSESDIDLFILKDNLDVEEIRSFRRRARKCLRDLIYKYHIGFDIIVEPTEEVLYKEDYFYKVDLLQNGVVIYESTNSK